ncbi:MAG: hypothetical protein RDU83_10590 [bacterium]|nr:hypothetical protein [bacterium]
MFRIGTIAGVLAVAFIAVLPGQIMANQMTDPGVALQNQLQQADGLIALIRTAVQSGDPALVRMRVQQYVAAMHQIMNQVRAMQRSENEDNAVRTVYRATHRHMEALGIVRREAAGEAHGALERAMEMLRICQRITAEAMKRVGEGNPDKPSGAPGGPSEGAPRGR